MAPPEARKFVVRMTKADNDRRIRQEACHKIEAFIIDTREKAEFDQDFAGVTTPEERKEIRYCSAHRTDPNPSCINQIKSVRAFWDMRAMISSTVFHVLRAQDGAHPFLQRYVSRNRIVTGSEG